jgi:DNA polymerase-3 subunit gamma/tau
VSELLFEETAAEPAPASAAPAARPADQVLYRKWRPQAFREVAGQDVVTRTLRNSIASGNLAHAYLFCGPRGTGKTTLGRLLAKAANCAAPEDGEPCNGCNSCLAFAEGRAMDFVEQDAASHNSVEDIRQLRENVVLTPMAGRRKVYLLDEVHMLSNAAENALLKTLEEPPPHIIFVLATTDPHRVAQTIISRCQRFDLRRIPMAAVVDRLSHISGVEGFTFERDSLEEIARVTTGSLRDAINTLEQVVAQYGPSPAPDQVRDMLGLDMDARSAELGKSALAGDLAGALRLVADVRDDGVDMKQFAKQTVQYLRGLLLVSSGVDTGLELSQEMVAQVREDARSADRAAVVRAMRVLGTIDWGQGTAGSLPLELALLQLADAPQAPPEVPPEAPPEPVSRPAPVAQAPAEPPATRPEPQFSVPAAEMDAVETSVGSTVVEPTAWEPAPARDDPYPADAEAAGTPEQELLDRVTASLRQRDRHKTSILNGSFEVLSVADREVVLGFYHTFHLERVESSPLRKWLEEAFTAELGRQVTLKFEHAPRGPAEPKQQRGGHLVQAARERGARAVPKDD